MPKNWIVSDDVRSDMLLAAVDASLHLGLASGAAETLAAKSPSKELSELGRYVSHAHQALNPLEEALRNKMTPLDEEGDGGPGA